MKILIKTTLIIAVYFLGNLLAVAQPPNDECSGAYDISEAFTGNCGDVTFNGPFDLTGSTPGPDDPPEPGEAENNNTFGPFCPDETDPILFGDDSPIWENSIWYSWTVPDLNGDGSPVNYSIWTSDGSFGDDCGLDLNYILAGDADTQVAIYEGPNCPNATTGACDHYAANEDLFSSPPWISGWLNIQFTPGVTYYMGVDGWDGVEGEFCLTVVICGVECGDGECAPVETYCECEDCQVDDEGNSICTFGNIAPIEFIEDDPTTPIDETGFLFADDLEGNIFFCSERINGYAGENTYLGFGALNWTDCSGVASSTINLTLSAGQFASGATDNGDGTVNIPTGSLLYIELTPDEIDAGSITITSSVPDEIGNTCDETLTINFADFPQASDPFCTLACFAGGIKTDLLDNGITVCEGESFTLSTNGLEDLTLPCNSDIGLPYTYAWRVYADLYETGDYGAVTSWQTLGTNPTINPTDFFIDEFGYVGPYYTPGFPILPGSVSLQIRAAALCLNADETIVDGCVANNEGYQSSQIEVTYLPANDPICASDPLPNDECINATDISFAFTGDCEVIGPFDQTDATIGDGEPILPDCFLDGYNGTTWYTFTVPDYVGGGAPLGYSISTGIFEDCGTTNPLGGGADVNGGTADTQMAIYYGEYGCPNTSAIPLACSDDTPFLPINYKVSSVELLIIPGYTYYIMIETYNNLDGEFCFYTTPTLTPTCVNCGDNSCTEVFGESFSNCPDDCPCVGEFLPNDIDINTGIPTSSIEFIALCPELVGASGDGLYIPFSLTTKNLPIDFITYEGSTLTTSLGTIYQFISGGSPILPNSIEGTKNVTLLYLSPAEIDLGISPTLTFVDATGECTISFTIDASLDVTCPTCSFSSSTLSLTDGSEVTSICINDDIDEPIEINISATGSNDYSAWVITDLVGDILALPDSGPPFILDGAGEGECLIWIVNWCDDLSEPLTIGANLPSIVATSAAAISNPITVVRNNCIVGCTDNTACNYNEDANTDDGSCLYLDCFNECGGEVVPGVPCDDNNPNTSNDIFTSNCICQGSTGVLSNDECVNAIDISEAFIGACGDFTFNGPFTLTGSTPGADDPPEPGEMENATTAGPFCPDETDANLFGDASEIWENSVWYTWTVPDLNGDGSPVAYSIWTSDGSFGDDCGLTNVIGGDADTQVAIYEGPDCPNASTDPCDHFAANEDLFSVPPWISGWLTLEFTPGTTYYMGVDGWDGVQGEFCLTVVLCGVECGDGECAPVETYCECEDCRVDNEGNSSCTFGNIAPIEFVEDDPTTANDESGFSFADDLEGNIFFCSERVNGFAGPNIYLGFGAFGWTDCSGTVGTAINLTLSAGQFITSATENDNGTVNIPTGSLLYIELTPEEIAAGSITISSSVPDGIGNSCDETITINFADFPQATDPFCTLTCFAGGIDTNILDNGLTICEGTNFELNTDGFELLDLPCNSDNGSSYQYAWRVRADLYGYGDYQVVTNWQLLGANATINPADFFIDEFGYVGPYYTPGYPILPNTVPLQIQGAALCLNADETVVDGCVASNEGYDNSFISVTYLPANNPACAECTSGNYDCAGICDGNTEIDCEGICGGSAIEGATCLDAYGTNGIYNAYCDCVVEISGCIDSNACNYDATATINDGSCDFGNMNCIDPCNPISGCTDIEACNYMPDACLDDGSCMPVPFCNSDPCAGDITTLSADNCSCELLEFQMLGCVDETACNYDPDVNCDNGSCTQADPNFDCAGNCQVETDCAGTCGGTATIDCAGECGGLAIQGMPCVDSNGNNSTYAGDCACPDVEILGCTDNTACNYDANANTNNNTCTYADPNFDCAGNCEVETDCAGTCGGTATIDCAGECGGSAIQGTPCVDSNGNNSTYTGDCTCPDVEILGCTDNTACNYDANANTNNNTCTYAEPNFDCAGNCEVETDCAGTCGGTATIDCAGECGGSAIQGTPCVDSNGNNSTYTGDCACPDVEILGCTDNTACNYDANANTNNNTCTYAEPNFDCAGNCQVETDCAGTCGGTATIDCAGECGGLAIQGEPCIDLNGNNSTYTGDCTCPAVEILGCTDNTACNYNADANTENNTCTYAEPNFDCAGNCEVETDCAGTCGGTATIDCAGECGGLAIQGTPCVDSNGNNSTYTGDCTCPDIEILGCTDNTACNYDANANTENNTCTYAEPNFDCAGNCEVETDCAGTCGGTATIDCAGECGGLAIQGSPCVDSNGNNSTYTGDCTCPDVEILGCTDNTACNYNADANTNNNTCSYAEPNFDCAGNCLVEVDCNGECAGTSVEDCTGTCGGSALPGSTCMLEAGGIYDENCNCIIEGCTNPNACNYFSEANLDDGSCAFPAENFDCAGGCLLPIDCEGTCGGNVLEGSSCNDGNPNTIQDKINSACLCEGTLLPTCNDGIQNGNENGIDCGGSCPPCIEDNLSLSLTDPCNCNFGIDINSDNVNDWAREIFVISGGTPPFTVNNSTGNYYDTRGNTLSNADLSQLINNSILQVWVDADNTSTHSISIIDSNGLTANVTGGPCGICPEFNPADIPTLSQWGLILLCLILLSITTVSIIQNKTALANNGSRVNSAATIPYLNKRLFKRMLLKSIPLMLLIFVLISLIEGGWFIRNLVGTILSVGMLVYLFHFIILSEQFKNEE